MFGLKILKLYLFIQLSHWAYGYENDESWLDLYRQKREPTDEDSYYNSDSDDSDDEMDAIGNWVNDQMFEDDEDSFQNMKKRIRKNLERRNGDDDMRRLRLRSAGWGPGAKMSHGKEGIDEAESKETSSESPMVESPPQFPQSKAKRGKFGKVKMAKGKGKGKMFGGKGLGNVNGNYGMPSGPKGKGKMGVKGQMSMEDENENKIESGARSGSQAKGQGSCSNLEQCVRACLNNDKEDDSARRRLRMRSYMPSASVSFPPQSSPWGEGSIAVAQADGPGRMSQNSISVSSSPGQMDSVVVGGSPGGLTGYGAMPDNGDNQLTYFDDPTFGDSDY